MAKQAECFSQTRRHVHPHARAFADREQADLWEEALMKEYNMADVFDDYTMSLIQFGYVALFSAAFPLAPLLAMINNLVQTRVDAHKICKTRYVPTRHCSRLFVS